MAGSAAALSLIALLSWAGRPGTGLLLLVFVAALVTARRDAWRLCAGRGDD
jgi:hypothetical protein